MISIDISGFKRDPEYFKTILKQSDNKVVTKKDLIVLFPQKFVDKGLTDLGVESYVLGIIAIVDPDTEKYTVLKIPGRLQMMPMEIEKVLIDDTEYVMLEFEANTDLISDARVVKEVDFMFDIFDTLLIKGKMPWYLNYRDPVDVFAKMKKYTGTKAANNRMTFELLTSIIARYKDNKKIQYRNYVNEAGKEIPESLAWVGLENIFYSFNSTLSKVAGAYMELGIVSAILDPEKEISDLEHVVRE